MKTIKLVTHETNNFGDQIIVVEVNGKCKGHIFHEGNHVNIHSFLDALLRDADSLETSGADALNRIYR